MPQSNDESELLSEIIRQGRVDYAGLRAGESDAYLEPEDSPFSPPLKLAIRAYELMVAKSLLEPAEVVFRSTAYRDPQKEIASLVCLPSFEPEWALCVAGERMSGFSVLLTEAKKNIWYSSRNPEVGFPIAVSKSEGQLAADLGGAICDVWRKVLSQTRYPKELQTSGRCDGVTYHFAYWGVRGGSLLAGKAWSPAEESVAGKLVAVSHALRDYLGEAGPSRQQIVQTIEEHLAWLQKQAQ
jgi:hypothetical protein